ncbi:potassium transporter TrkA [Candidatus Bathyarchaeota archaeon]|nr:MAG: potassium transporter TrkA [Candidatus Bathyarchaeota archaeon]
MRKGLGILGRLQKTPKWKKVEFDEIEYKAHTVKEILTEMKNISELIIDLAYSVIIFKDEEIAEEVKYLETRMDYLNYEIRMMAMLAARTREDAEQLTGILQIAEAAETISNAAGDIANLVDIGKGKADILPKVLKRADEKIFRIKISPKSSACNKLIGDLAVESETGMHIIAIRRGEFWIYDPGAETMLKAEDTLIVRGTEDGFDELKLFLTGKRGTLE